MLFYRLISKALPLIHCNPAILYFRCNKSIILELNELATLWEQSIYIAKKRTAKPSFLLIVFTLTQAFQFRCNKLMSFLLPLVLDLPFDKRNTKYMELSPGVALAIIFAGIADIVKRILNFLSIKISHPDIRDL